MKNDEELREAYERGLPLGEDRPPLDDVAAERLRRLVEREGSDEERLHTVDSLLASAEGRRELELVWAASRAAQPVRRRQRVWLAAAGALLAVGLAGTWMAATREEATLRGDGSPITLVAPLGSLDATPPYQFVWRPFSGAERYTLLVVDSTGAEVYSAALVDTVASIPAVVRLEGGHSYVWWVQATTRLGASVTSLPQRVTVSSR